MVTPDPNSIESAEVSLPCDDLTATLRFFQALGFQLETILPADDPAVAVLSAHGVRLRLDRDATHAPGVVRLRCGHPERVAQGASELTAPNGTRVLLVPAHPPIEAPPLQTSLVVSRLGEGHWTPGRAGMRYRDLIPDRQGGRFGASHIQVLDGGPVPDYVHHHGVRFQMIFCYRGWVRVVYEDQGEPFVLEAGDCVLQPPRIRHRVLESSPGCEVIELSSPAVHETSTDHDLELPTATVNAEREFGGQRFVRHQAATSGWMPWGQRFECRDLGLSSASDELVSAQVLRPSAPPDPARDVECGESGNTEVGDTTSASPSTNRPDTERNAELRFLFALQGTVHLDRPDGSVTLQSGDSVVIPQGEEFRVAECSDDTRLLRVTSPAPPADQSTPNAYM